MNYLEWFSNHRDTWNENALAITVTSDKLGSKAEMLSLTCTPLFNPSHMTRTFFLAGADPSANRHITGIDLTEYAEKALGRMACAEQLKEGLSNVKLLVSYSGRYYTSKLLEKTFPEVFLTRPVLDVTSMCKAMAGLPDENLANMFAKSKTLEELIYWTEIDTMSVSGQFGLSQCLEMYGLSSPSELPQYLRRGVETKMLFNYLTS